MRFVFWDMLVYIITAVLILQAHFGDASRGRAKRVIAFRKGTSFFYRLNYKINAIETSTIFAQATGFKVVWKLPSSNAGSRKRRNVDEIHENAALVYESHGFDGKSCVAKNICQALEYANGRDGVMAKILKLLSNRTNYNETESAFDILACKEHAIRCPLELVNINKFVNNL